LFLPLFAPELLSELLLPVAPELVELSEVELFPLFAPEPFVVSELDPVPPVLLLFVLVVDDAGAFWLPEP
jgi:hypothetical protein